MTAVYVYIPRYTGGPGGGKDSDWLFQITCTSRCSLIGFQRIAQKSAVLGMLEALKEVVFFMKTGSQKGKHFPAEIRQNFPLPDRNRNRKMEPDIRPEPDFAGYPVGS